MPPRAAATWVLLAVLWPAPAAAWGFDVHRLITDRAIALLPAPIRPFFEKHRVFVVEHSIDPDLWRTAGFAEEPPRHFLDLDAYGRWPFEALPREYGAAVRRFGRETVDANGLLPWRAAEIHAQLVGAFGAATDPARPYALDDVKFFTAVLAHYAGDAFVPFHATKNYDGQLTGQHGIHSRFETELVRRFEGRLRLAPAARPPVREARDFIFDALLSGYRLVDEILAVDRRAVAGRTEYDDAYFDRFFAGVQAVLERRLTASIEGVAALVAGAWEAAGRPVVPLEPARVPRKVKRP
ncbi:MAG TPA: hypothetical protein VNI83_14980 [Vicinamibacterales bacterium]|nr:hypothetical protein [Vicinamibacterales bacterium]